MKLNLLLFIVGCAGLIACDNSSSTAPEKTAETPSRKPSATRKQKFVPPPGSSQAARKDTAPGVVAGGIAFPPAGEHRVELFALGVSKAGEAIAAKLKQALVADPAWAESFIKEREPGQPLPYHPKMGITKEEYAAFLKAAKGVSLVKVSDVVVRFARAGGKLTLHIEGVELPADTFEFSADGQTMECSLGTSGAPEEIDQKKETSPTGPWKGSEWTVSIGNPEQSLTEAIAGTDDAYEVAVAIGKDTLKRNLICLRMTGRLNQTPMDITYLLRWPQ